MKQLIGLSLLFLIACNNSQTINPDQAKIDLVTKKAPDDDSAKFKAMVDSIKKANGGKPGKKFSSVETSGHFIRSILNKSPKDVEKALGKADKPFTRSTDCDYLPTCMQTTYQKGKFEALFYENKLKWLEINRTDLYNSNAVEWIGFPKAEPTFTSDRCIFWRSAETRGTATGPLLTIRGLRNISACSEWVIVSVDTHYKGKL